MRKFPSEFSEFIKTSYPSPVTHKPGSNEKFVQWFPNLVKGVMVKEAIALIEENIGPYMRTWNIPIPEELIKKLKRNYTETLPKTFHNDSVMLNNPKTLAYIQAKKIGLVQMLGSESLRRFAEKCSGYTLYPRPGFQVSRYKTGDYIGPHNDHHPEDWNLRDGYIDLHITLSNDAVASQYFIYENNGNLNQIVKVSVPSGITVSRLPYWHQVTPLIAKKGKEAIAQRWLLLVSYSIKPTK